ncbi:ABC transporter permease [Cohnella fermenti]|uniref:Sugar ABC transporter permease n=1 Tax=Cohnella fermenti TaxID=2565925 RepID=A0A4S4BGQ3_9BACL|nr:ABC transporter permease subunit [Cohnella fermenti]THF73005.1 sugar ABC transporter permease [Cohnella fermenti]
MEHTGSPLPTSASAVRTKRKISKRLLRQNIPLYAMFIPIMAYFIIFKYYPMTGLIIAFKNYRFIDGIWGSSWNGLDNFRLIFGNDQISGIIWNTLKLSGLSIVVGFPMPILLAILVNEVRRSSFKRAVQTMVFLPHFLNWVIVGGIVLTVFSQSTGAINHLLDAWFGTTFPFLYQPWSWLAIYLGATVWKEAGWGMIIYLAALTSIDQSLYEAASIDGASKWQQIRRITLPGIMPTVIIMLVLKIGHLMEVGFDQIYVLQNQAVADISEVISTFMYKIGIQQAQFSLATAIGLFESLVGLVLVVGANRLARRFGQGLW